MPMTVNIAIIDSGINASHPHVSGVAGGISFHLGNDGCIVSDSDYADHIGHGTAIAGLIRQKVPDAAIYAVRIFHKDLNAPGDLLLAGLNWAIDNSMGIIHLSLGTEEEIYRAELESLCNAVERKNIIIIAAGRHPDDEVLPAAFRNVIGVYWHRDSEPGKIIHHPACNIEFGAHGRPRPLPGLPQAMNFKGHSFAVGRITAEISRLLTEKPSAKIHWLKQRLSTTARVITIR